MPCICHNGATRAIRDLQEPEEPEFSYDQDEQKEYAKMLGLEPTRVDVR